MGEKSPRSVEAEPVTAQQILDELSVMKESIEGLILKHDDTAGYNKAEAERVLDLLRGKIDLFSKGLLPSDDYSRLKGVIDQWLGLAKSMSYSPNNILTSEDILKKALNAVQGNLIVNHLLSDEALEELGSRWPKE
jgi:hypothetical protein